MQTFDLYSVGDVAKRLNVTAVTIRNWDGGTPPLGFPRSLVAANGQRLWVVAGVEAFAALLGDRGYVRPKPRGRPRRDQSVRQSLAA